jgi:integrase
VNGKQTVSKYLDFWLRSIKGSIRPRTYESYDLNVRRLTPSIGSFRLSALKPAPIEAAYAGLRAGGLSNRSIRQAHIVLHGAMKKAVQWELIGRNPCDAVSAPRADRQEMKTFDETQVKRLFEASKDDRLHALWVVLVTSGVRLGEAIGLQWQDLDLSRGSITINRSLQRQREAGVVLVEPKTKASRRKVFLAASTMAALDEHRNRQLLERVAAATVWQGGGLIFCRPDGRPLEGSNLSSEFHKLLERAELPRLRIHDLRHTAATLLLAKGVHAKVVQEMLGHTTITITLDTYSHVAQGMHEEAARTMDSLFGAPATTK